MPFALGHKQFHSNDFKDIHQKIMVDYYKKNGSTMLCSEFVAHTMIASMVELNVRIRKDAAKKHLAFSRDIIIHPISKHENLGNMHPDRLLGILKKKGCVDKIETPNKLKKYFDNN